MEATKQQTTVDWLMEKITYYNGYGCRYISFSESFDLGEYFQQAKAMEKKQIIDSYESGIEEGRMRESSEEYNLEYYENAEQYYTETYETKDQ